MALTDVPILIGSRDRLTPLLGLIDWLEKAGCERILLIDNDSKYEPLLEYYERTPHTVVHLGENVAPRNFWSSGVIDAHAGEGRYVLSDPDVVPTESCPLDALARFDELLDRFPSRAKVGFGLKLDDLPAHSRHAESVRSWEGQFWQSEVAKGVFDAKISTTFALYRAETRSYVEGPSLRTGEPYVARHIPWYSDVDNPTAEERFYRERFDRERPQNIYTTWNNPQLSYQMRRKLGLEKPPSRTVWARATRLVRRRFWPARQSIS